ncbi:hypothetical protein ES703_47896 [subsurface metagenome]
MAKIVNSWNEWDPLKRVIVGKPEGTNIPLAHPLQFLIIRPDVE